MKLYCAAVGGESVFSVRVNESDSVDDLKEAIKTEKLQTITCDADQLDLYFAKNGERWLTENQDKFVSDTNGLTHLKFARAKLRRVGLTNEQLGEVDEEEEAAGNGPVNVLVVIPGKMWRIGVDVRYADTLSSYMKIAERLKDTEEVRSLSRYITNVIAEGKKQETATPFIVLENSSGTGKTQMAFNLHARGECEVFYIVCVEILGIVSKVCITHLQRVRSCVRRDLETLKRVSLGTIPLGRVGQIQSHTTLALYLAALRGQDVFYGIAERSDVVAELEKRGTKPFVFFLDEFPRTRRINTPMNDKDQLELENALRTMRNVFRSFNLAVVISSTNATARALLTSSSRSRELESYLWCVMIPSIPGVVLDDDVGDVPKLVMNIIRHSRPLFAQIAINYVQDNR